jgi:crotonobetainyl-CoA:carnitine CoA-transferase CaiB-like acyl-CoA transferase
MTDTDRPHPPLPLDGLRIVEVANVVAGPSVGKHLSDFGAEVVKVERPGVGDTTRQMGQTIGSRTAWWVMLGRNKRSVVLDLKDARGREAFLALCETADAVVESQRPGVLESLDLAPETLQARNERLVVVRISGYGQTGPYARRPGFGTLAEAFSGMAGITGYADGPPLLAATAVADEVAGLFATWSLMVALYGRELHGLPGQVIDVSLYEALFAMLGPLPLLYHQNGYLQGRHGSRLPWSAPRNVYCSRDGHHFAVSGTAPGPAEAILRLIGGDALVTDARFGTPEARGEHSDELDERLAAWIAERDAAEVDEAFERHGIAGVRVLDMPAIFADPHVVARATLVEVDDEELGSVVMPAPVPRFSLTPGRISHTGPELGRDTDDVLRELGIRLGEALAPEGGKDV